jgi:hypothetical protein
MTRSVVLAALFVIAGLAVAVAAVLVPNPFAPAKPPETRPHIVGMEPVPATPRTDVGEMIVRVATAIGGIVTSGVGIFGAIQAMTDRRSAATRQTIADLTADLDATHARGDRERHEDADRRDRDRADIKDRDDQLDALRKSLHPGPPQST